jgi:hypothetical protein
MRLKRVVDHLAPAKYGLASMRAGEPTMQRCLATSAHASLPLIDLTEFLSIPANEINPERCHETVLYETNES